MALLFSDGSEGIGERQRAHKVVEVVASLQVSSFVQRPLWVELVQHGLGFGLLHGRHTATARLTGAISE